MFEAGSLRRAIVGSPMETSNNGESPRLGTLYLPPAHIKALRLESNVVIGSRGVGKSFWAAALGAPELRAIIGTALRELDSTDVHIGFSFKESIDDYPNADSFEQLMDAGVDPYDIWRAVIARWLSKAAREPLPTGRWAETVAWIKQNPEDLARVMQRSNGFFLDGGRYGLIVFDALDRSSANWSRMDNIVRGLLRATLWLKSNPRLHAKVFLREDQFERTVTDFPDASKLLATKAELTWAMHDLHGLLWLRLINAPGEHGATLRRAYAQVVGREPLEQGGVFYLADEVKRESNAQRALFDFLAGPWMGKDKRRGVPYAWSVGHLADGRGQTSPRSFLAAISQAAEDSMDRYPDYPRALHYESIKRGIQKASENRVDEMAEDYPWVRTFLEKLRGLNVPTEYGLILDRWRKAFPKGLAAAFESKLPAQHADRGEDGIRDDLVRLGVLELKKDGRIDMPDLYRVGFGLGRMGGVKPRNR